MKVEKTLSSLVLVDDNMIIIPEVLDFTTTLLNNGLSPNTVKSYLNDLKIYYLWLDELELKVNDVKPEHFPLFVEYLDSKSAKNRVAPSTLNRYIATISSFYRHFELMGGFVVQSPTVKVSKGKFPKQKYGYLRHVNKSWNNDLVHYFKRKEKKSKIDRKRLYPDEVIKFFNTIHDLYSKSESLQKRNKLIFKLLYETGMRVGELLHLQINDIDIPDPTKKTGNIYLIEREEIDEDRQLKSGERTIPVSMETINKIENYLIYHRPNKENIPYLFVSHSRNNLGEPIRRSSIETWFNDVSKETNIKCTPHSLRHTHASNLADAGIDSHVIKARLGHKSIETSAKYVKPSLSTLILSHERYMLTKEVQL